jgi:hypothetical protein
VLVGAKRKGSDPMMILAGDENEKLKEKGGKEKRERKLMCRRFSGQVGAYGFHLFSEWLECYKPSYPTD